MVAFINLLSGDFLPLKGDFQEGVIVLCEGEFNPLIELFNSVFITLFGDTFLAFSFSSRNFSEILRTGTFLVEER